MLYSSWRVSGLVSLIYFGRFMHWTVQQCSIYKSIVCSLRCADQQLDQHRMSSLISAVPCLGYSDLLLVLLVVVDTLDVLAPEVLGVEFQTKVREDFPCWG